jgi:PadR family transcriptional regulator PadR
MRRVVLPLRWKSLRRIPLSIFGRTLLDLGRSASPNRRYRLGVGSKRRVTLPEWTIRFPLECGWWEPECARGTCSFGVAIKHLPSFSYFNRRFSSDGCQKCWERNSEFHKPLDAQNAAHSLPRATNEILRIIGSVSRKGMPDKTDVGADRDLYSGLIRLHILHHAVAEPIFGLGMIEELARHGYRISPGSLYPLLHGLENKGYLRSTEKRDGKSFRRMYRATPLGRRALVAAKSKVRELFRELIEEG